MTGWLCCVVRVQRSTEHRTTVWRQCSATYRTLAVWDFYTTWWRRRRRWPQRRWNLSLNPPRRTSDVMLGISVTSATGNPRPGALEECRTHLITFSGRSVRHQNKHACIRIACERLQNAAFSETFVVIIVSNKRNNNNNNIIIINLSYLSCFVLQRVRKYSPRSLCKSLYSSPALYVWLFVMLHRTVSTYCYSLGVGRVLT